MHLVYLPSLHNIISDFSRYDVCHRRKLIGNNSYAKYGGGGGGRHGALWIG